MIQKFIDLFMLRKDELMAKYSQHHPENYEGIFRDVVGLLKDGQYHNPQAEHVHVIDDGEYQGTLVFVVSDGSHSQYWVSSVGYGSCSGCDTFCAIQSDNYDDPPTKSQAEQYVTLALHMVQEMKEV